MRRCDPPKKKEHSNYLKPSGHEKIRAFARNSVYLALGCIGSGQHTHATMPKMKLGSCRHRFSWCSCGKKVRLKLWQLGSSAETIDFRLQTDDPIPHWDIHFACWVRQVQNIGKKWQEPDLQCACCMSKEPCPSFPRPIALRWSLWCPCQKLLGTACKQNLVISCVLPCSAMCPICALPCVKFKEKNARENFNRLMCVSVNGLPQMLIVIGQSQQVKQAQTQTLKKTSHLSDVSESSFPEPKVISFSYLLSLHWRYIVKFRGGLKSHERGKKMKLCTPYPQTIRKWFTLRLNKEY